MVQDSVFQGQQITGTNLDALIRQIDADAALKQLNRYPAIYVMLIHPSVGLHENQNNMKIRVFGECFRATAGRSLPRILASQSLQFLVEIELEYRSGQGWQPFQGGTAGIKG